MCTFRLDISQYIIESKQSMHKLHKDGHPKKRIPLEDGHYSVPKGCPSHRDLSAYINDIPLSRDAVSVARRVDEL